MKRLDRNWLSSDQAVFILQHFQSDYKLVEIHLGLEDENEW